MEPEPFQMDKLNVPHLDCNDNRTYCTTCIKPSTFRRTCRGPCPSGRRPRWSTCHHLPPLGLGLIVVLLAVATRLVASGTGGDVQSDQEPDGQHDEQSDGDGGHAVGLHVDGHSGGSGEGTSDTGAALGEHATGLKRKE